MTLSLTMQVARRSPLWAARLAFAWLCAGCALLTPTEDVRPTIDAPRDDGGTQAASSAPDSGGAQRDAGPAAGPASNSDSPGDSDAGDDVEDADPGPPGDPGCSPPAGAACDPVKRCGCSGQECELRADDSRLECVDSDDSKLASGERCTATADCAAGHMCSIDRVCSPYCAIDADCGELGKCKDFGNPATGTVVPGARSCTRECDVLDATPCKDGTSCFPNFERWAMFPTCRYLYDDTPKKRGEPCEYYNECDVTLACAEFGPRVCTSYCRTSMDCPSEAPHCYTDFVRPMLAQPGGYVGHCVEWPCDDASVGAPPVWTEGPVWTADQSLACMMLCGPARGCWRLNCRGGERWGACVDRELMACVGASGGPCREEYVALMCTDINAVEGPERDYDACAIREVDCVAQAEAACGIAN